MSAASLAHLAGLGIFGQRPTHDDSAPPRREPESPPVMKSRTASLPGAKGASRLGRGAIHVETRLVVTAGVETVADKSARPLLSPSSYPDGASLRQGTIEVHIIRRFAHNLTDLPNPALCALVADSHRWQELKRAVLDLGIRKGESGHACGVWRFAVGATEGYDGFARLQVLARNGVPLEGSA